MSLPETMLEDEVQQRIQLEASKHGIVLMRNNSGAFKDGTGRFIFFGLGNISKKHSERIKSSDLIGIKPTVVTQDMVGKTVGIFVAIEAKKEGWKFSPSNEREAAQNKFIEWIKSKGGIAGFCNSVDSFVKLLRS